MDDTTRVESLLVGMWICFSPLSNRGIFHLCERYLNIDHILIGYLDPQDFYKTELQKDSSQSLNSESIPVTKKISLRLDGFIISEPFWGVGETDGKGPRKKIRKVWNWRVFVENPSDRRHNTRTVWRKTWMTPLLS